jgi:hypothetical protein
VVAETLDRILGALPETPGDKRVLDVIGKRTEKLRRN